MCKYEFMFYIHLMSLGSTTGLTTEIFLTNTDGSIFDIKKDDGSLPIYKQIIAILPLLLIVMIFIIINIKINERVELLKKKFLGKEVSEKKILAKSNENIDLKTLKQNLSYEDNENSSLINHKEISPEISQKDSKKISKKSKKKHQKEENMDSIKKDIKKYFDTYQQLIVSIICSLIFTYFSIQLSSYFLLRILIPIAVTMVVFTILTISIHSILRNNSFSSLWLFVGYLKFDRSEIDINIDELSKEEAKFLRRLNYCFTHYVACIILLAFPLFYSFYNDKNLYSITKVNQISVVTDSGISGMVAQQQVEQQTSQPILNTTGAAMTAAINPTGPVETAQTTPQSNRLISP